MCTVSCRPCLVQEDEGVSEVLASRQVGGTDGGPRQAGRPYAAGSVSMCLIPCLVHVSFVSFFFYTFLICPIYLIPCLFHLSFLILF